MVLGAGQWAAGRFQTPEPHGRQAGATPRPTPQPAHTPAHVRPPPSQPAHTPAHLPSFLAVRTLTPRCLCPVSGTHSLSQYSHLIRPSPAVSALCKHVWVPTVGLALLPVRATLRLPGRPPRFYLHFAFPPSFPNAPSVGHPLCTLGPSAAPSQAQHSAHVSRLRRRERSTACSRPWKGMCPCGPGWKNGGLASFRILLTASPLGLPGLHLTGVSLAPVARLESSHQARSLALACSILTSICL